MTLNAPVVYLAHPIGKNDADRHARLMRAMGAARSLVKAGFAPIVPGFWSRSFGDADEMLDYEGWMRVGLALVVKADAVFRLRGESAGADREVAYAKDVRIPVFYALDDLKQWRIAREEASSPRCSCGASADMFAVGHSPSCALKAVEG